jgi:hypothetical protein
MAKILYPNIQLFYSEARLDALLQVLDELHTAASEDRLSTVTAVSKVELVGWLHELVYTANETIAEVEGRGGTERPDLNLVEKSVS